jgi:hypothetical protein
MKIMNSASQPGATRHAGRQQQNRCNQAYFFHSSHDGNLLFSSFDVISLSQQPGDGNMFQNRQTEADGIGKTGSYQSEFFLTNKRYPETSAIPTGRAPSLPAAK